MAKRFIEDRHEAKLARRVVDVRPAGDLYAEWLSDRLPFAIVAFAHLLFALAIPLVSPFIFLSLLIHIGIHVSARTILPFRYPVGDADSVPNSKTKADGILMFGRVDSDSEYERFKEVWFSDDDTRKHKLIIGSTGSGKSETLKGIFFNALCWSSGFFIADGKADNKLPADTFTMTRSFGRDMDLLVLNFLLGGRTPEQVRLSRRRRTNKINPVSAADADTIIQMGANMLPKVEGEGKNWQEKALNLWRAVVVALCYLRDTEGWSISVSTIIDYLALPKVEELFIKGYEESMARGEWSYGFAGIKSYLETGCPAYKVDKLLAKNGYGDQVQAPAPGGRGGGAGGKALEQDSMAFEQHSYRTNQLMPVLNLLDKTYGYIFRDKFPEIDMIDVTLNNRILVMLIPSLEKSAQEAENLGKLAIACLRVMMGKNLGSEIEGTRGALLDSKATNANYPYIVALDELAYYFADGIAVMFAQARSLGFCMVAAAQDLEKLTEGTRAAEAGAMLANSVLKYFMRIDDAQKTYDFIKKILGTMTVAVRNTYELGTFGFKRSRDISVQDVDRVTLKEMQEKKGGEGVINSSGKTVRVNSLYVADDLKDHANPEFWVNRFVQVEPASPQDVMAYSIPIGEIEDPLAKGRRMLAILKHQVDVSSQVPMPHPVINAVAKASADMSSYVSASDRSATLYIAARNALAQLGLIEGETPTGAQEAAATAPAAERTARAEPAASRQPEVQKAPFSAPAVEDFATGMPAAPAVKVDLPAYVPQVLDDDVGDDPLAFLDPVPYKRKAADQLLAGTEIDALRAEVGPGGDTALPDVSNAVDRFFANSRGINLRRPRGEGASMAPPLTTLYALAGRLSAADGKAAHGDPDAWIRSACGDAGQVLAAKVKEGQTVVGFADVTLEGVAGLEEILGSPSPEAAARSVEAVVSARVTPNVSPLSDLQPDEIDDFFKRLESGSK